jgi:chromate reductase
MWKLFLVFSLFSSQALIAETNVLLFAGSTRKDSYNKMLIAEAAKLVRESNNSPTVIDLKEYQMPFYDADLEEEVGMPENASTLRQLMIQSSVIVIASPEYNSSVSAVLKNALDWASRSETASASRSAFKGKKFVLLSASPGGLGGKRGLVHLRTIIEDIGGTVLDKQVCIAKAYNAFDDQGNLKDPKKKAELKELLQEALK